MARRSTPTQPDDVRKASSQSRYTLAAPIGGTIQRRAPRGGSIYSELGATGLKAYSGRIMEEWLADLQGLRAVQIYREMAENDAVVGATLYALEMMMRRAKWRVDPAGPENEHQIASTFLESCLDDMETSWGDLISEVLSFLRFGWSYHEEVYKLRKGPSRDPRTNSKHTDGLVGWRKMPIRAQETLFRWDLDIESGDIRGMWQIPPPTYQQRYVPKSKSILFRTSTHKNNPEGRSLLRTAYRSFYFKRRLEEIEAIGLERDLSGLPILTPPEDIDIMNNNDPQMVQLLADSVSMVTNIRRDELEGVVLPFGWNLSLLSSGGAHGGSGSSGGGGGRGGSGGGKPSIGEAITRYQQHTAMVLLADFILLGHENSGTYSLSSDKTDMFNLAVNAWLDVVAGQFNREAVPRLMALNPSLPQDKYPTLAHDGVDTPNMSEIGAFIQQMTGIGVLTPDPGLEDYVRSVANLPERPEGETDAEWETRHLATGDPNTSSMGGVPIVGEQGGRRHQSASESKSKFTQRNSAAGRGATITSGHKGPQAGVSQTQKAAEPDEIEPEVPTPATTPESAELAEVRHGLSDLAEGVRQLAKQAGRPFRVIREVLKRDDTDRIVMTQEHHVPDGEPD